MGAWAGGEVADTDPWQELAAAPGTRTSLDGDGSFSSRRRGKRRRLMD